MPKQFKTYTRFDGGLNTKTNARSIADNELAQANNVIIDEFGMVKSSGKAIDNDTNYTDPSLGGAQQAGYGLFQAVMDFDLSENNRPTVMTFLADPTTTTKIDISEETDVPFVQCGSFSTTYLGGSQLDLVAVTLGSGTANGAAIYDIADGVVRIADANFGANNTVKSFQYIKRKLWIDSNGDQLPVNGASTQTISDYVGTFSGLFPPFTAAFITGTAEGFDQNNNGLVLAGSPTTSGSVSGNTFSMTNVGAEFQDPLDTGEYRLIDVNSTSITNINEMNGSNQLVMASSISGSASDPYVIATNEGHGFNIEVTQPGAGTMTAGTYEFAQTFIYDDTQESMPTAMTGTITIASSKYIQIKVIANHPYNSRISGGRIYMRDSTVKGEYELIADIDLSKGCRSNLEGEYTGWSTAYSQARVLTCTVNLASNNLDTFETLNGYSSSVQYNHISGSGTGYKTSSISNRRKFIANVKVEDSTGTIVEQPDRLMYSEINKFDTFTPFNFIDIGVNDGEEFVKLESYGDRLLAYKNRTLYIINIGGGSDTQWFLESSHQNMGVQFHAAVTKTPFGVVWANKNGLYLYDGSRITNLQTKIIESEWESFIDTDSMVGYEPTHKHVVVIRNASDESDDNGDAYIYSFITKSFTFVEDLVADNIKSNPITDVFNKMTMAVSTNEIVSYDGEPDAGTTFDIKLKDDDYGLPNVVKKIYGVTVEYASDNDSSNGLKYFYTNDSGVKQTVANGGTLSDTNNDLDVNRVTFSPPLLASSFQVQLDLDGSSVHKVNNVGVEYRPIYKRVT